MHPRAQVGYYVSNGHNSAYFIYLFTLWEAGKTKKKREKIGGFLEAECPNCKPHSDKLRISEVKSAAKHMQTIKRRNAKQKIISYEDDNHCPPALQIS